MKLLKWILVVIIVIVILLVAWLAYMGIFGSVKVTEREMGPYTIVYDNYVGPYANTMKVFEKVYKAVKSVSVESVAGIGIYYDIPGKVASDKLRSSCGAVIDPKDIRKIYPLRKQFKVMALPKKMSMVAEFPIRNSLSFMIGPMKGYPAIMNYMKEKGYKMAMPYEYYDMKTNKILYVMVIIK